LIAARPAAEEWGLVLEFELPLEARRVDALLLAGTTIIVLEFKGKAVWTDAGPCRGVGRNWCSGISSGSRLSLQAARSMH
jgi:hypothetical protein